MRFGQAKKCIVDIRLSIQKITLFLLGASKHVIWAKAFHWICTPWTEEMFKKWGQTFHHRSLNYFLVNSWPFLLSRPRTLKHKVTGSNLLALGQGTLSSSPCSLERTKICQCLWCLWCIQIQVQIRKSAAITSGSFIFVSLAAVRNLFDCFACVKGRLLLKSWKCLHVITNFVILSDYLLLLKW